MKFICETYPDNDYADYFLAVVDINPAELLIKIDQARSLSQQGVSMPGFFEVRFWSYEVQLFEYNCDLVDSDENFGDGGWVPLNEDLDKLIERFNLQEARIDFGILCVRSGELNWTVTPKHSAFSQSTCSLSREELEDMLLLPPSVPIPSVMILSDSASEKFFQEVFEDIEEDIKDDDDGFVGSYNLPYDSTWD